MRQISTPNAPAAIGPYSQGFVTGGLLYTSGQIALDPATGEVVGATIAEQAHQVMKIWALCWKRQALPMRRL